MGLVKVGLLVLVISGCILAATIRVPQDQPTIQAGINATLDGDTVLVGPGVYLENLNFGVKNIVLLSESGRSSTFIEASNKSQDIISILGGQDTTTVIDGFTIQGTDNAYGIHVDNSDPKILNCDINNCTHDNDGGGIYIRLSGGLIENCLIHHNHSSVTGGGIAASGAPGKRVRIVRNKIYSNTASSGPGIGCPGVTNVDVFYNVIFKNTATAIQTGGIYINGSDCRILNNSLVQNTKGITLLNGVGSQIRNNIVAFNLQNGIVAASATSDYNATWMNGSDNLPGPNGINSNPQFVDISQDSFQLQQSSPCIDAGDPNPIYNDPDGSRNDIGAIPFVQPSGIIRYVPSEYATVQSAIDASINGDTVVVAPGRYYERINFLGKRILLTSSILFSSDSLLIRNTILDGDTMFTPLLGDTGCVVRFVNGEDSNSVLAGFTITGGVGSDEGCCQGAGILVAGAGPRISKSRVIQNLGTGIELVPNLPWPYRVLIDSCQIMSNSRDGILARGDGPEIWLVDCEVVGNLANGILSGWPVGIVNVVGGRIANNLELGINAFRPGRMQDCIIENNKAGGVGYAFQKNTAGSISPSEGTYRAQAKMENVIVKNNEFGVIIYENVWEIRDCVFEGNAQFAIGIALDSKATLWDCMIRSNGNGTGVGGGIRIVNDQIWGIECHNTLFEGNRASLGGAIGQRTNSELTLSNCIFANNEADSGSAIYQRYNVRREPLVENCVFAFNRGLKFYYRPNSPDTTMWSDSIYLDLSCTNIFGNEGGDWIDSLASQFGIDGNMSADPLFCDTAAGDYTIKNISPCAPANNSCGVLIGAYGIGCENVAPLISSPDPITQVTRTRFAFQPSATDEDGPVMIYSYEYLPHWLAQDGDSVVGIPGLNDADTNFLAIVSDGFLADSVVVQVHLIATPLMGPIAADNELLPLHVTAHAPQFDFEYLDPTSQYSQTAFEIAVGTDNDWQYAELWNPAPVVSADTFVVYGGAPLIDGQTYWLRLRVSNSLGWSNWAELVFRMNSVPSTPEVLTPANGGIVSSLQPGLTIRRVPDAEGDSLLLTFEVANDSSFAFFVPFTAQPGNDSLTTVNVPFYLTEDQRYWWRVKASDYYEESNYSPIWSFWINSENSAPTHFNLIAPANSFEPALTTTIPLLEWTKSNDIDPFDQVSYALHLAIDSSFSFASITSGIDGTSWQPSEPLNWGTKYWWKVKATDLSTGVTWSNQVFRFRTMRPGDPDGNGQISISDAVFLINYIFASGPAPVPLLSGDADCSGAISISDAVYLINYIFGGGPEPCETTGHWR
ncbi:MAG: hypothetical protein IT585_09690 [candidate division Zixibacteria bacterium]|nr:hypothetical protein [candidate division Zixibacteria bacterium]